MYPHSSLMHSLSILVHPCDLRETQTFLLTPLSRSRSRMTLTRWLAITANHSRLLPLLQAKESLKAMLHSLYKVPSDCFLRSLNRTELSTGQSNSG